MAPAGVFGGRGETGVLQGREHFADRRLRYRDGRCQHPQAEMFGAGRGLGEQRRVLASHERRGHADPQLAVPACDVVDQVCQALRHRCFGMLTEQGMQLAGGFADIQGMPDRLFADAVHHRRSGGLDSGHCRQFFGEVDVPAVRAPRPSGRLAPESDRSAWAGRVPSRRWRRHRPSPPRNTRPGRADRTAAHQTERVALRPKGRRPARVAAAWTIAACARSTPSTRCSCRLPRRSAVAASMSSSRRRSSGAAVE